MSKKVFDGIVMISFLTMVASHGLIRSWSRRHLAEGHPGGVGNNVAGAVELSV